MNIPGMSLVNRAKATGNQVIVPGTRELGVVDFFILTFKQAGKDNLAAFAGSLVYSAVFAVFPFMTLLLSILGMFHMTGLINTLVSQAGPAMPSAALDLINHTIRPIASSNATGAFTLGAIISIIAALWSVSGGFRSIMTAMNVMYNVEDQRPFWKKYLVSILLSILAVVLLIAALVLLVFGASIGEAIAGYVGLGSVFKVVWNVLRWPVLAFFVLLTFAVMYYFAPDVKGRRFPLFSVGTVLTLILWLLFSLLFSAYVNNFGSYNKTYGTFAGVAIFLLYLYYSSYILLMGAEMNQVIENHSPDRPAAPPRDDDTRAGSNARERGSPRQGQPDNSRARGAEGRTSTDPLRHVTRIPGAEAGRPESQGRTAPFRVHRALDADAPPVQSPPRPPAQAQLQDATIAEAAPGGPEEEGSPVARTAAVGAGVVAGIAGVALLARKLIGRG